MVDGAQRGPFIALLVEQFQGGASVVPVVWRASVPVLGRHGGLDTVQNEGETDNMSLT